MIAGNADAAALWAGAAFDMPGAFARKMSGDAHLAAPVANASCIVGGSILVGHSIPLVEMGLLATLRRLTLRDVATLDEFGALPAGKLGGRNIEVVVADRAAAGRLGDFAAGLNRSGGQAGPKILLIGADTGSVVQDGPVLFDARLTLECRQQDFVETVNALLGSRASEMPAQSRRLPDRGGKDLPAGNAGNWTGATIGGPGIGLNNHRIEGIRLHAPANTVANPHPRGGLPPGALRRVREAMEQRLHEKLELTELAAVAGVSRCHFARAFKESVGQPPHRYLMMRRVEVAAELIKGTDRNLTDISLDMGFFDQSHFARVFTRVVGETPSAYRRKHR